MYHFSKLHLLFFTLYLAGCTLPKTEKKAGTENNASFFITYDGISLNAEKIDQKSSIVTAKTYTMQACFADKKYSKSIQNHRFMILNDQTNQKLTEVVTDSNGCLHWNETIPFDQLAQAYFVEQIRIIEAVGIQKGRQSLRFAINPWENKSYSLRDREIANLVSANNAKMALSGQLMNSQVQAINRRLNIQDMRISMYDTETMTDQRIHWNIEMRTEPELITFKSNGQIEHLPLKSGLFDAEISIIHVVSENGKEVRRRIKPLDKADGKIVDGSLLIEKDIILPMMCTIGQVQLGLKLTAKKESQLNLEPFESVFILGQCDSIKSNYFSRQKTVFQVSQGKKKIEEYLTSLEYPKIPTNLDSAKVNFADQQSNYYIPAQVEVANLNFSEYEFARSSTNELIKTFTVTACISAYDRRPMSRQAFEVYGVNGEKVKDNPRSDVNGCITWNDSITYHLFDQECERDTPIRIINKNIGMDQTIPVTINPWSHFFGAYKDLRTIKTNKKCAKPGKSYIIIQGDSYNLTDISYKINNYLGIEVERKGILRFHPTYFRPTMTNSQYETESGSLPMGSYLLRWAVVTNAPNKSDDLNLLADHRHVLYVGEKIVDVLASDEVSFNDFKISTDRLKDLGNTVQFVLEMSLLKPNYKELQKNNPQVTLSELEDRRENFEYYSMAAPVILKETWSFGNFSPVNQGESLILKLKSKLTKHKEMENQRQNSLMNRKDLLAKKENLLLINLNEKSALLDYLLKSLSLSGQQVTKEDLQKLLNQRNLDTRMKAKMCEFWFDRLLQSPLYYLAPQSFTKDSAKGQSYLFPRILGTEPRSQMYKKLCLQSHSESYFDTKNIYFIQNIEQSKLENVLPISNDKYGTQHRSISTGVDFSFSESISENLGAAGGGKVGLGGSVGGVEIEGGYAVAISKSANMGSGMSIGISLDVDMVPFELTTKEYEQCVVVKLNPRLFAGTYSLLSPYGNGSLPHRVNSILTFDSDDQKTFQQSREIFSKGLLICEGQPQKRTQTMKFVETFFFINQPFESSTGAVMSSLVHARRLFASLRGENAWLNFMGLIRGQMPQSPEQSNLSIFDAVDSTSGKDQQYIRFGLENAFRGVQKWPGLYIAN